MLNNNIECDSGLSFFEKIMKITETSSPLTYLTQKEALPLRLASKTCRDIVREHVWGYEDTWTSQITGSLSSWRSCFPRATYANLNGHLTVTTEEILMHLRGITVLDIRGCRELISEEIVPILSKLDKLIVSPCISHEYNMNYDVWINDCEKCLYCSIEYCMCQGSPDCCGFIPEREDR